VYSISKTWMHIRNIIVFLAVMNSLIIDKITDLRSISYYLILVILLGVYFYINILPSTKEKISERLFIMRDGYRLILDCSLSAFIEIILYGSQIMFNYLKVDAKILVINGLISIVVLLISFMNGFLRIILTSRDLGITSRLLILFFWWLPVVNIVILRSSYKKVKFEYYFEQTKMLRNEERKENEICKTKYPVILVHGIFFRDWMFINYWGRIPRELKRNGAEIYYGHQQSSNPVSKSAEELKTNIMKVIEETGCEKVNIIAHSKGGLDSRYAISCLGLSEYVASLTTINTPHRGCKYVDFLLNKIPDKLKEFIAQKYNKTFIKLGDNNPDFLGGVTDLTAAKCSQFNKEVIDAEGVLYQSITSKMVNAFSAPFPLNLGYIFARIFDGENDGLVAVDSAKWGDFLELIETKRKGVSHGDVIDLMRIDLQGYDVCECYVDILKKLKERGF